MIAHDTTLHAGRNFSRCISLFPVSSPARKLEGPQDLSLGVSVRIPRVTPVGVTHYPLNQITRVRTFLWLAPAAA